jgi:hypothetical protein
MKAKVVAASPVCLTMNAPVDILKISTRSFIVKQTGLANRTFAFSRAYIDGRNEKS